MKKWTLFLLLMGMSCAGFAQNDWVRQALKMKAPKDLENIHVERIYSDDKVSSFSIWIKKRVPLHKHASHSEHVYVLRGKGIMRLGDQRFEIKKGDFIVIPEGTPHDVTVVGKPLQVLSIQAPEFKGKDRIKLE